MSDRPEAELPGRPEPAGSGAPSGPRKRPRRPRTPRIGWPVLAIMSGGFFFITALLLWFGAVITVRCDRMAEGVVEERLETRDGVTVRVPRVVQEGRVDVTAEHRILGLLPCGRNGCQTS